MRCAYTLNGMHGLGDNLHERAIVRELMRGHDLWLKTSWPQLFWDLPELHLVPLKSPIPWMARNEIRTAALYGRTVAPPGSKVVSNGYLSRMRPGNRVSVLQTMADVCGVPLVERAAVWRERRCNIDRAGWTKADLRIGGRIECGVHGAATASIARKVAVREYLP